MFGSWLPPVLQLLGMNAGQPVAPGPITHPAEGWHASDDGLVYAVSPPRYKDPRDSRVYFMDFEALTELTAGDTIAGAAVQVSPAGLFLLDVAVDGPRILVTLYGGSINVAYGVSFTANLQGGSAITRTGTVRVQRGALQ